MLVTSIAAAARCPLCGARHASCGPRAAAVPVDLRSEEEPRMATTTRLYTVEINGVQRQMRLNEHDARQLGATPVDAGGTASTANVSDVSDKARKPANKTRRTATSRDRDES